MNNFISNFEEVYLRGTFNNFDNNLKMKLISDNVWSINVFFHKNEYHKFKFDIFGDWTHNYGINKEDKLIESGEDIPYNFGVGEYTFIFNDLEKNYQIRTNEIKDVYFLFSEYTLFIGDIEPLPINNFLINSNTSDLHFNITSDCIEIKDGLIMAKKEGKSIISVYLKDKLLDCFCEIIVKRKEKNNIFNDEKHSFVFDLYNLSSICINVSNETWNNMINNFDQGNNQCFSYDCDIVYSKKDKLKINRNALFSIFGGFIVKKPEDIFEGKKEFVHSNFYVDFSQSIDSDFFGMKSIRLKSFKNDSLYVREIYCYDLLKRFGVWTTPFASYIKLYIHFKEENKTIYFGIYEIIENIDYDFIKKRNLSTNGTLWSGTFDCGLEIENVDGFALVDHLGKHIYPIEEDSIYINKKIKLKEFIVGLNDENISEEWIEKNIEIDLFLRILAINTIVGNWDEYGNSKNNYFLYFDEENKAYPIVFDYDNTLGNSFLFDTLNKSPLSWGWHKDRPLIYNILSKKKFKNKYLDYIFELIDEKNNFFDYQKSLLRIMSLHKTIDKYILNDVDQNLHPIDEIAWWSEFPKYKLTKEENNYFNLKLKYIKDNKGNFYSE